MTKEIQHGRPSTYNNHKCRCDECKAAWAAYMRDRVKRWRANKKAEKRVTQRHVKVNL